MRLTPMVRMLNQWPDIWDEGVFNDLTTASNNLDVYETEDEVVVRANVAGVEPDEIDITFEKGILLIQAEADREDAREDKRHYTQSSWSYSYKIAVPGVLDQNHEPEAEVDQGVLSIRFKKSEATKPKKLRVASKS